MVVGKLGCWIGRRLTQVRRVFADEFEIMREVHVHVVGLVVSSRIGGPMHIIL